jgi:site-specific DNA-methyltransferase (adenine-specific)
MNKRNANSQSKSSGTSPTRKRLKAYSEPRRYLKRRMNAPKALLGDCLDLMKDIEDGSVDLILSDLPYGTTSNSWDSVLPLDIVWQHYKRIIKPNGAIVLFAQTPFDKILGASNIKELRYEWIWEKESGTGFLNAKFAPLKSHENILVFYKKRPTYHPQMQEGKPYTRQQALKGSENYGKQGGLLTKSDGLRYPKTILKFQRDKYKIHPTQKPVALLEFLIKTYSNIGDTVLDSCAGSFSTAIACINTERTYICIEKEHKYFLKGVERINEHNQSQNNSEKAA